MVGDFIDNNVFLCFSPIFFLEIKHKKRHENFIYNCVGFPLHYSLCRIVFYVKKAVLNEFKKFRRLLSEVWNKKGKSKE